MQDPLHQPEQFFGVAVQEAIAAKPVDISDIDDVVYGPSCRSI